jgi:hypothetical protein
MSCRFICIVGSSSVLHRPRPAQIGVHVLAQWYGLRHEHMNVTMCNFTLHVGLSCGLVYS